MSNPEERRWTDAMVRSRRCEPREITHPGDKARDMAKFFADARRWGVAVVAWTEGEYPENLELPNVIAVTRWDPERTSTLFTTLPPDGIAEMIEILREQGTWVKTLAFKVPETERAGFPKMAPWFSELYRQYEPMSAEMRQRFSEKLDRELEGAGLNVARE